MAISNSHTRMKDMCPIYCNIGSFGLLENRCNNEVSSFIEESINISTKDCIKSSTKEYKKRESHLVMHITTLVSEIRVLHSSFNRNHNFQIQIQRGLSMNLEDQSS